MNERHVLHVFELKDSHFFYIPQCFKKTYAQPLYIGKKSFKYCFLFLVGKYFNLQKETKHDKWNLRIILICKLERAIIRNFGVSEQLRL